jgi:hypothetical protein
MSSNGITTAYEAYANKTIVGNLVFDCEGYGIGPSYDMDIRDNIVFDCVYGFSWGSGEVSGGKCFLCTYGIYAADFYYMGWAGSTHKLFSASSYLTFKNIDFGNPFGNVSGDYKANFAQSMKSLRFVNCKFSSSTEDGGGAYIQRDMLFQKYNQVTGRHKNVQTYGVMSDQVTGGQAESWARGGSGICAYITPSSTTNDFIWEFYVPVAAATAFALHMFVKITSTTNPSTLKCTIFDTDDITKFWTQNPSV